MQGFKKDLPSLPLGDVDRFFLGLPSTGTKALSIWLAAKLLECSTTG